jgi:hypothetical protein
LAGSRKRARRRWSSYLDEITFLEAQQNRLLVLVGNADGEIAGLTITDPPTQVEVQALLRSPATLPLRRHGLRVPRCLSRRSLEEGGRQPAPDRSTRCGSRLTWGQHNA